MIRPDVSRPLALRPTPRAFLPRPRPSRAATVAAAVWVSLAAAICDVAADDWPQWRGPNRDGVWRESGLVDSFQAPKLQRRWTAEIAAGYSGPTVANGRVFVADRLSDPDSIERVHAFDIRSGEKLWSHEYACPYEGVSYTAGPRASVTVDNELAYVIGATGRMHCLDVADGSVVWQRDLRSDFDVDLPTWGITSSPLVEGEFVIVQIGGAGNACVVALDRRTGETAWHALDDDASYSSPIVIDQAGQRVLVVWTGERVVGMDPADGNVFWAEDYKWEKWPIGIASPVHSGDHLLVSEVHKGSLLLKLGRDDVTAQRVWHRSEDDGPALHALMGTPIVIDGQIYGADNTGVLRCLDLSTGEQIWENDTVVPTMRWATVHIVRNGDRVWMFNDRGELIIARLSPQGYHEISRAQLIAPTTQQLRRRDGVTWSHPAYADRHVFARNDEELVCADLSSPR